MRWCLKKGSSVKQFDERRPEDTDGILIMRYNEGTTFAIRQNEKFIKVQHGDYIISRPCMIEVITKENFENMFEQLEQKDCCVEKIREWGDHSFSMYEISYKNDELVSITDAKSENGVLTLWFVNGDEISIFHGNEFDTVHWQEHDERGCSTASVVVFSHGPENHQDNDTFFEVR